MKDIVEMNLEVFENLNNMLKSTNTEDQEVALETIKNINPSDIIIRLLLKSCAYGPRAKLAEMIGQNSWSYTDLTMTELYNSIAKLDHPNIENIRMIYEHLVLKHFNDVIRDYTFIDSQFKVKW
jgi:hypothetical protein